jgi:hypothetical protein
MNEKIDKRSFYLEAESDFKLPALKHAPPKLAPPFATVIDRRYREGNEVA